MKDNADLRMERLFAVMRQERMDTSGAEEYFETRLLARIREIRDTPAWYALVWRMVPMFALLAAVAAIGVITFNPSRSNDLFAAITSDQGMTIACSYLTGE